MASQIILHAMKLAGQAAASVPGCAGHVRSSSGRAVYSGDTRVQGGATATCSASSAICNFTCAGTQPRTWTGIQCVHTPVCVPRSCHHAHCFCLSYNDCNLTAHASCISWGAYLQFAQCCNTHWTYAATLMRRVMKDMHADMGFTDPSPTRVDIPEAANDTCMPSSTTTAQAMASGLHITHGTDSLSSNK